jgi:glutathionylspermidine synthase
MHRVALSPRPDWRAKAERYGFDFHSPDGLPYWDESVAWSFTLAEIEEGIEAPTAAIEELCLAFVQRAVDDIRVLQRLQIPAIYWDMIRDSWRRGERNLYGRLDFAYTGAGPAKLLEYNADTPTSLFEAAVFQWTWLEDQIAAGHLPAGADQFNAIHERLIEAFGQLRDWRGVALHLTYAGDSAEDEGTVAYLADCARQAGIETIQLPIGQIGFRGDGRFVDLDNRVIQALFKLYPWEWLFREAFGQHMPKAGLQFIEPPWKALLSTKGLLPYLWEMAPNHPNLLPAFFSDDPARHALGDTYVEKPLYSREGANVWIVRDGKSEASTGGAYGVEGTIRQALAPVAAFEGGTAVIGSWLVASQPSGLGIREDMGLITRDTARFVPHWIAPETPAPQMS